MNIMKYILDLGPSVMLPVVIFILAVCLKEKPGKALRSGIMIGIGFIGISLVVGLMLDNLGPAAKAMAERFGVHLSAVDVGWPGAAPMGWASSVGGFAIPIAIGVNILMLVLGLTRVVNVDIWNVWHMAFTGAMVQIATGSFVWGAIGIAVHAAFVYKLGDWLEPVTKKYFELEGLAVPHGSAAYLAPFAIPFEWLFNRIPGVRKINLNAEKIESRLGVIGEPMIIGAILGMAIGFLAGYDAKVALQLGMKMAAVMVLMPKMVKCIMEGLLPVAAAARKILEKKFKGKEFLIGLDPALLLGDPQVVSASLIFVPLTLVVAMIVPGNQVLPFGDLATIGFFVAMATGIHGGNLFRTIISGSFIMGITLWISTQMIGLHTQLAAQANALPKGVTEVSSLDQGGSPITYMLTQLFTGKFGTGVLVVGGLYIVCVIFTCIYYKQQVKKDSLEVIDGERQIS
ncbi:galactitol-specific PTS transporter subunit IIC [Ectobacillus funiculus]|uniref:PTS galactitol transporter subunit IIC n=1 Tax=Ectobacillus funiculus TaxID=137993 RepID=UPI0039796367